MPVILITSFCVLFFSWHANAQQRLIKGQITPKLAGCSVTLKGTAVAALTDSAGNYELSIPDSLQIDTLELVYDAGNDLLWRSGIREPCIDIDQYNQD